jgi:hypothetical protein
MAGTIDQKRLAALLGMIGSAHDGEALNAARLAHKLVVGSGLSWEQVLKGGGYTEDFVREVAAKAYAEGKVDGAPKPPRKTFAGYAKLLLEKVDDLTEWEEDFLASWAGKRYPPSAKQLAIFVRLAERSGIPIPAHTEGWADVGT